MTALLEVQKISLLYDKTQAVNAVSFSLNEGEIGCLLGPSGCGKTTLLRSIAGFEIPSEGRILLNGEEVSRKGWGLPPERRNIGMVFQDFALFPNLNVEQNIAFGLRRMPRSYSKSRIEQLLEMIELSDSAKKYPHQLSGGQQQRIALARAMAPRPEILLLDEPFSSMDIELREQLARDVRKLLRLEGMSAILVTHDQYEAFAMADQIGVMNKGEIQQWDSSYNLYHQPKNRFVADFIGQGVILEGTVNSPQEVDTELGLIVGSVPDGYKQGCPVDILVRPDDILHDDDANEFAEVIDKAFRGAEFLYTLKMPSGSKVLCLTPSHHDHAIGEKIGVKLDIDHLVIFKRHSKFQVE